MNWLLYVGLPLGITYLVWFIYLLRKKKYTRDLLFFSIAQLPYLILNLVAPFRGVADMAYSGYSLGLLEVPQGILVPIVAGGIVLVSLFFLSKAMLNQMERWWPLALGYALFLSVAVAIPILISTLNDPASFRLELGEYLQVSGYWVALLILLLLPLPTLYALFIAIKNVFRKKKLHST